MILTTFHEPTAADAGRRGARLVCKSALSQTADNILTNRCKRIISLRRIGGFSLLRWTPLLKTPLACASITDLFAQAVSYFQCGDSLQAEALFRQILQIEPQNVETLHLLGITVTRLGRFDIGISFLRQAIALNPKVAAYHSNLGIALEMQGQLSEAAESFREALQIDPNYINARFNLGKVLFRLGLHSGAVECYLHTLRLNPNDALAYLNLANVYSKDGRFAEAVDLIRKALELNPNNAVAHNSLGNALYKLGRHDEAIDCYIHALRLQPNDADAFNNLGVVLNDLDQFEQAIRCFRQALSINPNHTDAHCNLGSSLVETKQYAEAAKCYQEALRVNPENKMALWKRGNLRLLQGEWTQAWADLEHRFGVESTKLISFQQPVWDGSDLTGKTILVYPEGGFGDTINFVRFLPMLKRTGRATVLFGCQRNLVWLTAEGYSRCRSNGCCGYSLTAVRCADFSFEPSGHFFGTNLSNLPARVSPYISTDARLVEFWRSRLAPVHGFKVGIFWKPGTERCSIPLTCFEALARVKDVHLISLREGVTWSNCCH